MEHFVGIFVVIDVVGSSGIRIDVVNKLPLTRKSKM